MKLWIPNQQLQNGRFIIQKVLGLGGFGITYSVLEQHTGMALEMQDRPQTVREWSELLMPPMPSQLKTQNLKSSLGIDYTQLGDLLAAGEWQKADKETTRVMLAVARREKQGWLDVEHIDNFPCEDLRTIDQLWVKYSNEHFGFSVQKCIYESLGGTREYKHEIWEAFGDAIGWRKNREWVYYKNLTFSTSAPIAHLPFGVHFLLFSRIKICNV